MWKFFLMVWVDRNHIFAYMLPKTFNNCSIPSQLVAEIKQYESSLIWQHHSNLNTKSFKPSSLSNSLINSLGKKPLAVGVLREITHSLTSVCFSLFLSFVTLMVRILRVSQLNGSASREEADWGEAGSHRTPSSAYSLITLICGDIF